MRCYSYWIMIGGLLLMQLVTYVLTIGPLGRIGRRQAAEDWWRVYSD